MSDLNDHQDARDPEAMLRAHYAATDPGPVPADFVRRIQADLVTTVEQRVAPVALERVTRRDHGARLGFGLAVCAAVAVLVVGVIGLPGPGAASPSPSLGPSAIASATATASPSATGRPSGFPTDPATMAFFDATHGLVVGRIGSSGAIWRTADGGITWTLLTLDAPGLTSVAVNGNDAWVSPGSWGDRLGPAILESLDEGVTWTKVTSEQLDAMTFVDALHGFALRTVNLEASIATSADGGRTWESVAAPQPCGTVSAGGYQGSFVPSFVSAVHGWVLCEGWAEPGGPEERGIAETTDGGSSWSWVERVPRGDDASDLTLSTPDLPSGLVMRSDGTGLIWCLGGTLLRTEDGGRTWTKVSSAPFTFTVQPWIVASAGKDGPWYAMRPGADPLSLERSDDGGRTWSTVATGPRATPAPTPVTPPDVTPEASR